MHSGVSVWNKSKSFAVVLAVFLGPWAWLYTYGKDAWKFTLSLGVNLSILLFIVSMGIGNWTEAKSMGEVPCGVAVATLLFLLFVLLVISFATWLWAIVDSAAKSRKWYATAPKGKTRDAAVLLAGFVGPWTWLYTYAKDAQKFWLGVGIGFGATIVRSWLHPTFLTLIGWAIIIGFIWVSSFVIAVTRSTEWYESFPSGEATISSGAPVH